MSKVTTNQIIWDNYAQPFKRFKKGENFEIQERDIAQVIKNDTIQKDLDVMGVEFYDRGRIQEGNGAQVYTSETHHQSVLIGTLYTLSDTANHPTDPNEKSRLKTAFSLGAAKQNDGYLPDTVVKFRDGCYQAVHKTEIVVDTTGHQLWPKQAPTTSPTAK
jgi:hypothetical protein